MEDNSLLLVFMRMVQQCKKPVTIVLMPKTSDNHYHLDMTNPHVTPALPTSEPQD
jgi:hypothetical protein